MDDIDASGRGADTSFDYVDRSVDPRYESSDDETPPPVWKDSDALYRIIAARRAPSPDDLSRLDDAFRRQLPTMDLYRSVVAVAALPQASSKPPPLGLYLILFPGEGRDNTGLKDLNDKVLGFELCSEFIRLRQEAIKAIFAPGGFTVVGQDYKTASILASGPDRAEFARRLVALDRSLQAALLPLLDRAADNAEKIEKPKERKARSEAIARTRKAVKKKDFRFDLLFGADALDKPRTKPIETAFLLLTQALKGAGVARFISKVASFPDKSVARKLAGRRGLRADDHKKFDARGKAYLWREFDQATLTAQEIRKVMTGQQSMGDGNDYFHIFVDKVWTTAFLYYRRKWVGHPDVVRDVRKKALEPPPMRAGIKWAFAGQVALLELWLVSLNIIDLVKDFLLPEFRADLEAYHLRMLEAHDQLRADPAHIDWTRVERLLTRDLRLTPDPYLALGRASEYRFYTVASDFRERIFFTMDVRDLGVELVLTYEQANDWIQFHRSIGIDLMEETILASDALNHRKRMTYARVVQVFRDYFDKARSRDAKALHVAMGAGSTGIAPLLNFEQGVQVMLGGDEIFVAAHPDYAPHVTAIICALDASQHEGQPLNMRTAVTFSLADKGAPGPAQREANQKSHYAAMKLANEAPSILKNLERTHRRIERFIELLERNEKKAKRAPAYRDRLGKLRLLRIYARSKHGHASTLPAAAGHALLDALRAANLKAATDTKYFELVDLDDKVVDGAALELEMGKLEGEVMRDVGQDNYHMDPPPDIQMPKWLKKLIDKWAEQEEDEEDKRRRKEEERRKREEPRTA